MRYEVLCSTRCAAGITKIVKNAWSTAMCKTIVTLNRHASPGPGLLKPRQKELLWGVVRG